MTLLRITTTSSSLLLLLLGLGIGSNLRLLRRQGPGIEGGAAGGGCWLQIGGGWDGSGGARPRWREGMGWGYRGGCTARTSEKVVFLGALPVCSFGVSVPPSSLLASSSSHVLPPGVSGGVDGGWQNTERGGRTLRGRLQGGRDPSGQTRAPRAPGRMPGRPHCIRQNKYSLCN